jgi:dTDP-4-amino-4,6-dideoxy-D-galactose acyltransferase
MNYRILEWDSQFFGLPVAQINVETNIDGNRLSECLDRSGAEVIYVFLRSDQLEQYRPILEMHSGKCYDHKVTFGKPVDPALSTCDDLIVEVTEASDELFELAYVSGRLSRFFLDPLFRPRFALLYEEWIRKALRESGYKVYAIYDRLRMLGMATASVENRKGRIGLIAVDELGRGKGLGMRLLRQCETHYICNSALTCTVVTQKNNIAACKLYQEAGYALETEQHVWHIWKQ